MEKLRPPELSPKFLAEFLEYSFFFSQGDIAIQLLLFTYLSKIAGNKMGFNDELRQETLEASLLRTRRRALDKTGHQSIEPKVVTQVTEETLDLAFAVLTEDWQHIQEVLDTSDLPVGVTAHQLKLYIEQPEEVILQRILQEMVGRDRNKIRNRQREKEATQPGPRQVKRLSHIVHYIIRPGQYEYGPSDPYEFHNLPSIFQQLLLKLRSRLQQYVRSRENAEIAMAEEKLDGLSIMLGLEFIFDIYNKYHPDSPASLEDLLKE